MFLLDEILIVCWIITKFKWIVMLCWVQHLTLLWNFTQSSNPFTYTMGMGKCFLLANWFKFSLLISLCSNKLWYVRSFIINKQKYLILQCINLTKIPDNLGWEGLALVCGLWVQALWNCSSHSFMSMFSQWRARKPRAWHTPGMEQNIH